MKTLRETIKALAHIDYINDVDLECLSIDVLTELLDRAISGEISGKKSLMKIDDACKGKVKEFNKMFGTNYSNIFQVCQHYSSL